VYDDVEVDLELLPVLGVEAVETLLIDELSDEAARRVR
jgi:hypothetical protein